VHTVMGALVLAAALGTTLVCFRVLRVGERAAVRESSSGTEQVAS